jgi:4-hydroxy-tetrahydrodipicolinate synthase
VPIVATGSFGLTIEDKAIFAKKIYETGIDAVILITGHFANVDDSDEILIRNFNRMLELTPGIPFGLYECPAPYKRILTAKVFKNLAESGRFIYHKDTSIEKEQVLAKLNILKESGNTTFEFFDAHTPNARTAAALLRIKRDAFKKRFHGITIHQHCIQNKDTTRLRG